MSTGSRGDGILAGGRDRNERAHARLLGELSSEKVSALSRIARTLEGTLARLDALHDDVAAAPDATVRRRLVDRFNDERDRAETWAWYLIVQREALGFRRHDDVERLYRVPARMGG